MSRFAAAALATMLLAACGSSGAPHSTGHNAGVPIGAAFVGPRMPGLLGTSASAGLATSYVPKGPIVADSGFRPQVDGFSFENYGNDAGPALRRSGILVVGAG